ncbi:cysteine desulfurase family protein [Adlercreutzia sp. R7]|uniref:cysteine desulfurase n=1 Tax=Adlercreutzia wanghongyangiae TaxID=3111451 RepID=A0ABU6IKP5_9ACTN|nr:cysteine desulfurase family protein [Adlercreutzia sp. R7]
MPTYLDYNATTPIDPRVADVMHDVYINHLGNAGSRTHLEGEDCRKIVEQARATVASLADVDTSEVVFTSGATESDNIAILGLAEYGKRNGRKHLITTAIEHKAVLNAAKHLEDMGFDVEYVPAAKSGTVAADDILGRVRDDTLAVSVMHVNNETGIIQPVQELGERLLSCFPHTFFHIDAAQSFGKLVVNVKKLKYDLMSVTAHKMYGPQGIGALITRRRNYALPPISPLFFGGGQERGISPGTQPVALIAGFGKAAELCSLEWVTDYEREVEVKSLVIDMLSSSGLQFEINGDQTRSVPTCINVSFEQVSSEALMIATKQELSISNGSACTSSSYEPSYVLTAMGLDLERAESAVRISWGRGSNPEDVSKSISALLTAARLLQR